jgi:hypothetical protein
MVHAVLVMASYARWCESWRKGLGHSLDDLRKEA